MAAPAVHTRHLDFEREAPAIEPQPGDHCWRDLAPGEYQWQRTRSSGAETDDRTTWTINTNQEDTYRTIIPAENLDLTRYEDNPIVLINHRHSLLAGQSTVSVRGSGENARLVSNMTDGDISDGGSWDLEDPDVARYYRKVTVGLMRGASIGFRAYEWEKEMIDPDGDPYDWSNLRYRLVEGELLEWSVVTIPSNPGALVTDRAIEAVGGIDRMHRLSAYGRTVAGVWVPAGLVPSPRDASPETTEDAPSERQNPDPECSDDPSSRDADLDASPDDSPESDARSSDSENATADERSAATPEAPSDEPDADPPAGESRTDADPGDDAAPPDADEAEAREDGPAGDAATAAPAVTADDFKRELAMRVKRELAMRAGRR